MSAFCFQSPKQISIATSCFSTILASSSHFNFPFPAIPTRSSLFMASDKWTLIGVLKSLRKYSLKQVFLFQPFCLLLYGCFWAEVCTTVPLLFAVIFYKYLLCSLESSDSKSFSHTPRPLQGMLCSSLGRHLGWTQQGIWLKMLTADTSALSIYCGEKERQKDLWGRQITKEHDTSNYYFKLFVLMWM